MTKTTTQTHIDVNAQPLETLSLEEMNDVVGGKRQYNVYSNGGFYSGANVHSFGKHRRR
jgi:hypothetical protein